MYYRSLMVLSLRCSRWPWVVLLPPEALPKVLSLWKRILFLNSFAFGYQFPGAFGYRAASISFRFKKMETEKREKKKKERGRQKDRASGASKVKQARRKSYFLKERERERERERKREKEKKSEYFQGHPYVQKAVWET